ncbi:MAG: hypothetical protein R3324_04935 [Halobacteriales archaeon]|nr:hypothetical protein [Halobacteriales archaeon]
MGGDTLKSIDLHLEYPAGEVVAVDEVVDVGAGIYPVYYYRRDGDVLVSTSVTELVHELGTFERNPDFDPPNFLTKSDHKSFLDRLVPLIPDVVRSPIPPTVAARLRDADLIGGTEDFYASEETADRRISVLRPFERVTATDRTQSFEPTYELDDPEEFVERSAREIQGFVNRIERRYPDREHVIRVGGKDSQLIALAPKLAPENWHVFSAEPNYPLVREFLEQNEVPMGELFRHDNVNEETPEEFRRKVVCGDLRASPRHQRWYPTLEDIVERFDGECVFWIGTAGDAFNRYYTKYHASGNFFGLHLSRASKWVSITHQVTKNYTGAAALSPYHSESIWENLYRIHDPGLMSPGMDLRPEIAAQWYDRDLWWPEENPSPAPYDYDFGEDYHQLYYDYVEAYLGGETASVIRRNQSPQQTHSSTSR